MAYNNGFPMGYQPQQPTIPQPQPQNNGLIWVQGDAGARSFLVAPNTTVPLWDSEAPVIYLKSADSFGMPSMKVLDYTIREASNLPRKAPISEKTSEYTTKDEFEAYKQEIAKKLESIKEDMGA